MKAARNLSFETSTWEAIDKHMKKNALTEVSGATEYIVLQGLDAIKREADKARGA